MIEIKTCSICNKEKELTEFYSQKKNSKIRGEYLYYNPECKECTKSKATKWKKDNPDKYKVNYTKVNHREEVKIRMRVAANKQRLEGKQKEWQRNNKDKIKEYIIFRSMNKTHEISTEEWSICKEYFNNQCAYCGINEQDAKEKQGQFFHKEHVVRNGANDLSNCVPSCRSCNCKKWEFSLEDWYNKDNPVYNEERLQKIHKWLNNDYIEFLENKEILVD